MRTLAITLSFLAFIAHFARADDPVIPQGEIEALQVSLVFSEKSFASGAAQPAPIKLGESLHGERFFPATIEIKGDGRWNFRRHVRPDGSAPNGTILDLDFLKRHGNPQLLANGDKVMLKLGGSYWMENRIPDKSSAVERLVINFGADLDDGGVFLKEASSGAYGNWWDGIGNKLGVYKNFDPAGNPRAPFVQSPRASLQPTWYNALRHYQTSDSHFVVVCSAEDRFLWVVLDEDGVGLTVDRSEYGDSKETLLIKSPATEPKRLSVEFPAGKMALIRHTKSKVTVDLIPAPAKLEIQSDLPYATIRKSLLPAAEK